MAALSGTAGSVVYTTSGTTLIVGMREWSLDFSMDPPDVSRFGVAWRVFIQGIREYSGSFGGLVDTDASYVTLRNAALGGSVVALRLYEGTSTYWNIGTAYLTGMSPSTSYEGAAEVSFDFQGSDALTYV